MNSEAQDIHWWVFSKLNSLKDHSNVLIRDYLHLLPESDNAIHNYARENDYTVIVSATNLVFRELYEHAIADADTKKLLVIDRTPLGRRMSQSLSKAPPPFYPDLLMRTKKEAVIDLDLRQFLKERTGDSNWPKETNEPRYARLIVRDLEATLRAHRNLRILNQTRFTDQDFKTIIAFASLGVAEAAFKKLSEKDLWRIGLLRHEALAELDSLIPEVTKPINEQLQRAEAPFCWFVNRDSDTVVHAFYLSLVLAQHLENWQLLLANIDPRLASLPSIKPDVLTKSAPQLVELDAIQAGNDLEMVEAKLSRDALQLVAVDQMKIAEPAGFTSAIERESYSILFRALSLLMALADLVSSQPSMEKHKRIASVLFPQNGSGKASFVENRTSPNWSHLKEAYFLAFSIEPLRSELTSALRDLTVKKADQLQFSFFREIWNGKKINRLEYYLSALERLIDSGDLLPRSENELPTVFIDALKRIRQRVRQIANDVHQRIDDVNRRFQEMVGAQYSTWIANDGDILLTSQFLRRCVKPYWDPQTEAAVVLLFDGMRYDAWDELLKPMLEDRLEILKDFVASSLLPSETEISRWAIAAGSEPKDFWPRKAENVHLKQALHREFSYQGEVEVVDPEGLGTGETVHYRAGNLDYYIFEFCDKELHRIQLKELSDGRLVPKRPLSYVYQQHLKNIIDTEVMAIVRRLAPSTKVFITSDHGFARVGRDPLWFSDADLNEKTDCSYLNCWLRVPFEKADFPAKLRSNIISFTPEQLRLPTEESRTIRQSGSVLHKQYGAIVFPKVGYSFSRRGAPFKPDAYTHGGISIQELMVPMIALKVRERDEGLVALGAIDAATEFIEGEEISIHLALNWLARPSHRLTELRIDVEASYGSDRERFSLPKQVLYLPSQHQEIVYRFKPAPEEATEDEQRNGVMERTLTIACSYLEGVRTIRKSQTHRFSVKLKSERVMRRLGNLGKILGLTPKSMK